ncbi:MAG: hypothetical protein ACE5JZ_11780 [Kiloniellales bacterium]
MSLTATLSVLATAAAVFVVANLRSRRPAEPGTPRLIPYGAIQFVALVTMVLMLAHLVSLLTGQPFTGRRNFPR